MNTGKMRPTILPNQKKGYVISHYIESQNGDNHLGKEDFYNSSKKRVLERIYRWDPRKGQNFLQIEVPIKDEMREGYLKVFDDFGKIVRDCLFSKNVRVGRYRFYVNDKIIREADFKDDDKKEGYCVDYYPGLQPLVKKQEGNYENNSQEGLWKFYDKDGNLEKEQNYRMGILHGGYKKYLPNGVISEEGQYLYGEKDGIWFYRDENNMIIKQEGFIKGVKNGSYIERFPNGDLKVFGTYKDGKFVGDYYEYYSDNRLKKKCTFANDGTLVGEYVEYDENNAIIKYCSYDKRGALNGDYFDCYTEEGKSTGVKRLETHYRAGEEEGAYIERYRNGNTRIEARKKAGRFNGEYLERYESGERKIRCTYKNGKYDGTFYRYNENKVVEEMVVYVEGSKEGQYVARYPNGNLKEKGSFRNDVKVGYWREYYDNNRVKCEGGYRNGVKSGRWIFYDEDGHVTKICKMVGGEIYKTILEYAPGQGPKRISSHKKRRNKGKGDHQNDG